MEAIRRIVQEIVFICRVRNVQVSDTLSAFMARAVVLENADKFPLDKELNESDVQELIKMACERLCEADSPPLETVKMQVALDAARLQEGEALEQARAERERKEGGLVAGISETRLKPGNDVEALTALYRKIFNFLVVRAGLEPGTDRPAEREIAAALESVFPRIGLKAFTALPNEDKVAQLHELSNIVLGIRLFNRHIGKGGAGIVDLHMQAASLAAELTTAATAELQQAETVCGQYVDVIAHKYRAPAAGEAAPARLQAELTNRRQYASYMMELASTFKQAASHVEELSRMFLSEMQQLQTLVGNRSSVPKEQVYPRFDSLAKLWSAFREELALLHARQLTLSTLRGFDASFSSTLRPDDLSAARAARRAAEAMRPHASEMPPPSAVPPRAAADAAARLAAAEEPLAGPESTARALSEREASQALHEARLEIEGFCLYTVVQRDGLLLPAAPSAIALFRDRYYGFVDAATRDAFVEAPAKYHAALLGVAKRMPELIHMLRLQEHFPAASIAEIMRQNAQAQMGSSVMSHVRSFQDAASQTPTHFVEKHIDYSYEWNEFALRRRALHLANLRQKVTKSTQMAVSAFRRESETQVYLPTDDATQTGVSTGTNPPQSVNYIAGLRGAPDEVMELVNLTIDPEIVIGKYR